MREENSKPEEEEEKEEEECSTVLCLHNQLNLNLIFFIKKQCNSYGNFIKRYSHLKERNFYVINEEMSVVSWLFSMQKIFFLF